MNFLDADFALKVYEIVAQIPLGKVATYGQIAEMLGEVADAREIGHIMSHATSGQGLPCHRVVNKTGALAPEYAFGGQEKQRKMLEEEGITFLANGRINMDRHLWGGYEQMALF